jgi:hypothetical protein
MAISPKREKLRNRRCVQRRWCGRLLADRNEAGGLAPENHRPAMPELATRRHACLLYVTGLDTRAMGPVEDDRALRAAAAVIFLVMTHWSSNGTPHDRLLVEPDHR